MRTRLSLLALVLSACAPEAMFPSVVALTPVDGPVLDRLADRFDVVNADQADLDHTLAIAVDLDIADAALFDQYAELIASARAAGIPFIFDNASDPDEIASVVGIGAEGDAVVFHPYGTGGKLTVYERPGGEVSVELHESETAIGMNAAWDSMSIAEQDALLASRQMTRTEVDALMAAAPEPYVGTSVALPVDLHLDEVAAMVGDSLLVAPIQHVSRVTFSGTPTAGQRNSFWVDYVADNLSIGNQTARLNLNHYVDLVYSSASNKKYTVITADNGDIAPGNLSWNVEGSAFSNANIGWYRDRIEIRDDLGAPGVRLRHSANGVSNASGYTTHNNCTFTTSSGVFHCGAAGGWQSLSEWTMDDDSDSGSVAWSWNMVETDSGTYSTPDDLADIWWGGLNTPGALATGGFTPDFEGVWEHDPSLDSVSQLTMHQTQMLHHVWTKTRWLWQNVYWESVTQSRQRTVSIDYSTVHP